MQSEIKISPENLLVWGDFEDWENGASAAPTEHTLTGVGATVAREATIVKKGTYSVKVTRVTNDVTLYYDLPQYADYKGRKIIFGCWIYATVASRVRIAISDGVGSTNSSYHAGNSAWQFITVTHNMDSSATRLRVEMQVNTGDTSGYFDGGILCEGDTSFLVITDYADINEWIPTNVFRGGQFTIPRRPGVKVPKMIPSSKSLKIKGKVVSNDQSTTRSNWDTLNRILLSFRDKADGNQEARDLYLFDDRFLRGHLQDSEPEFLAAIKVYNFDWRFLVPEPFFQAINKTRVAQSLAISPVTFTVTPAGSVFSRPVIKVTAGVSAITSLTVENLTTGQVMSYVATIAAGQSLVIDTEALTVQNNGTDDIGNITGDTEMVLLPGGNQIKITSAATGGTAKIDWFDRWF